MEHQEEDMSIIRFFGKPECINNEKQKKLLTDAGHMVESINILDFPWTKESLRPFFGSEPVPVWFNSSHPAIKSGEINPKSFTEDEAIKAMLDDRLLIKRPLMVIEEENFFGFSQKILEDRIGGISNSAEKNGPDFEDANLSTCPHLGSADNCATITKRQEPYWNMWLREGRQYLKAGGGEKGKFNNSILYNLLAMSLEKFVMAILGFNMAMPVNHTFTDLLYSLEKLYNIDKNLKDTILKLESVQEICSFEDYVRNDVSNENIKIMRDSVKKIESMANEICIEDRAPELLFA